MGPVQSSYIEDSAMSQSSVGDSHRKFVVEEEWEVILLTHCGPAI
jgi:hypothetical protein